MVHKILHADVTSIILKSTVNCERVKYLYCTNYYKNLYLGR